MAYNKEIGKYEGWIYIILNDIEPDMVYIGQTYDTLERRWIIHLNQIKYYTDGDKLHKKMEKYGIEHFGMDILEYYTFDSKEELISRLDEREIYLISKFDSYYNGFNATKGGRNGGHPKLRGVQKYDLNGNLIAEYESVVCLQKEYNSLDSIYACCSHKRESAFGYVWRYVGDNQPFPIFSDKHKKSILHKYYSTLPIKKYNYKGDLIHVYKNVEDVLENENISRRQLMDSCSGKSTFVGYNIFRFNHESFDSHRTYDPGCRIVEKYSLDGELLDVYKGIAEAARLNGVTHSSIFYACSGKLSVVCGYNWRYGDIKGGDKVA